MTKPSRKFNREGLRFHRTAPDTSGQALTRSRRQSRSHFELRSRSPQCGYWWWTSCVCSWGASGLVAVPVRVRNLRQLLGRVTMLVMLVVFVLGNRACEDSTQEAVDEGNRCDGPGC